MNPLLNVLVLALGALALLALSAGFTSLKNRWRWLGQLADTRPIVTRLLFVVAAAGMGLGLQLLGVVLPPGVEAWLPNTLEGLLLGAAAGAVSTGSFAQARREP